MASTGLDPNAAGDAPAPAPDSTQPTLAPDSTQPTPAVVARPKAGKGLVRRAVGWLVRAALLVIVVVGIGGGIYFGWPVVYDRYLAPVQTNTADLGTLRTQVADLQRQVDELVAADFGHRCAAGLDR